MSLDGTQTFIPYTLNGVSDAGLGDTYVPYIGSDQTTDLGSQAIRTTATPALVNDLTNKDYVDTAISTSTAGLVPYTGATTTVDLNSRSIRTTAVPTLTNDLTNKDYVDAGLGSKVPYSGAVYDLDLGSYNLDAAIVTGSQIMLAGSTPTPARVAGYDATGLNFLSTPATYLTNLTSDPQTQLTGKASLASSNIFTGTNSFSNTVSLSPATATATYTLGLNGSNEIVKYTPSGGIGGSVSTGYVPYASAANTLADSIISQTAGQISVAGKMVGTQVNLSGITTGDGGIQSELTNILNLNLNFRGTTTTAERGVALRLDGRSGVRPFQFYYRAAGSTTESEYACIDTNGNFGIGTIVPQQKLDVSGDGARIQIESNTSLNAVLQVKTNANYSYLFTDQLGHLQIYPGSASKHLLLLPGGNVGIGTTTPAYKLDVSGSMRVRNGDDSMCLYGPNTTWGGLLFVGAGNPLRSGIKTAAVQVSDGNLHIDAGNGYGIYYGYNAQTNASPNPHLFYGSTVQYASNLPQNSDSYAQVLVLDGTYLKKSQAVVHQVVVDPSENWGPGSNWVNAFYRYNGQTSQMIMGRLSYYQTGAYMAYYYIRVYSQSTGQTWTFPINNFTNVAYNHITVPFFCVFNRYFTTTTGWFDIYVYNVSGCVTDTNDVLDIHVVTLPVSDY